MTLRILTVGSWLLVAVCAVVLVYVVRMPQPVQSLTVYERGRLIVECYRIAEAPAAPAAPTGTNFSSANGGLKGSQQGCLNEIKALP